MAYDGVKDYTIGVSNPRARSCNQCCGAAAADTNLTNAKAIKKAARSEARSSFAAKHKAWRAWLVVALNAVAEV